MLAPKRISAETLSLRITSLIRRRTSCGRFSSAETNW